jgi:small subunit ribosomal protein S3e
VSPNNIQTKIQLSLKTSSESSKMSAQISKKRKFVADGVFRAELNEFFTRELAEEGYSGCDVRVTHARTEVDILVFLKCKGKF